MGLERSCSTGLVLAQLQISMLTLMSHGKRWNMLTCRRQSFVNKTISILVSRSDQRRKELHKESGQACGQWQWAMRTASIRNTAKSEKTRYMNEGLRDCFL